MAQRKPAKIIKLRVPKHNSQRLNPKLSTEVKSIARKQKIRIDTYQQESSSALAQAVESASDWNSLLTTARAERGPQWDVGTQQFLVDELSELYFDPTVLIESAQPKDSETSEQQPLGSRSTERDREFHSSTPQSQSHRSHSSQQPQPGSSSSGYSYPSTPMRGPGSYSGGAPFNAVPSGQFYNGPDMVSGMRMGQGQMGMGIGMGAMDVGHGGHQNPMGMMAHSAGGISPDIRRRVTRGMGMGMPDEGYSMH